MSKSDKPEATDLKKQIDKSAKLFDVAQPGKTAASSTSKPVIVGHKAETKRDPMVVDEAENSSDAPSEEKSEEKMLKPKRNTVIAPLNTPSVDSPEENTAEAEVKDEKPKDEPIPADNTSEVASTSEAANVAAVADSVDSKQALKKEKKELEDKKADIDRLIESKQFYVSVGQVTKRRRKNLFIFTLLVIAILSLVALNFAIDAEIIDAGIEPLTDVF